MEQARKELNIAKHLLDITATLVVDPKIYSSIFEHLYKSASYCIKEFLEKEYREGNIKFLPENEDLLLGFFIENYGERFDLPEDILRKLKEMVELRAIQKESIHAGNMEKVIMITKNYKLTTLNKEKLENFKSVVEDLIEKVGKEI
ncbi:hypothetical protein DRN63_00555 [Nanoarchaeota archaeon]|nr:MAG: hypothetical protein DRN63_00555 [Nanoarchaeota archaeon]